MPQIDPQLAAALLAKQPTQLVGDVVPGPWPGRGIRLTPPGEQGMKGMNQLGPGSVNTSNVYLHPHPFTYKGYIKDNGWFREGGQIDDHYMDALMDQRWNTLLKQQNRPSADILPFPSRGIQSPLNRQQNFFQDPEPKL